MLKLTEKLKKETTHTPVKGIVVDNDDPKMMGRIKCEVVGRWPIGDKENLPWVHQRSSSTGSGSVENSVIHIPEIGSEVSVVFPENDDYSAFYTSPIQSTTTHNPLFDEDYPDTYGSCDKFSWHRTNKKKRYHEFFDMCGFTFRLCEDGNVYLNIPKNLIITVGTDLLVSVGGKEVTEIGSSSSKIVGTETVLKTSKYSRSSNTQHIKASSHNLQASNLSLSGGNLNLGSGVVNIRGSAVNLNSSNMNFSGNIRSNSISNNPFVPTSTVSDASPTAPIGVGDLSSFKATLKAKVTELLGIKAMSTSLDSVVSKVRKVFTSLGPGEFNTISSEEQVFPSVTAEQMFSDDFVPVNNINTSDLSDTALFVSSGMSSLPENISPIDSLSEATKSALSPVTLTKLYANPTDLSILKDLDKNLSLSVSAELINGLDFSKIDVNLNNLSNDLVNLIDKDKLIQNHLKELDRTITKIDQSPRMCLNRTQELVQGLTKNEVLNIQANVSTSNMIEIGLDKDSALIFRKDLYKGLGNLSFTDKSKVKPVLIEVLATLPNHSGAIDIVTEINNPTDSISKFKAVLDSTPLTSMSNTQIRGLTSFVTTLRNY